MNLGDVRAIASTSKRMGVAILAMTLLAVPAATAAPVGPEFNMKDPPPAALGDIGHRTVGVNAVSIRSDSDRDAHLEAITSEGFRAVRLAVEWPLIEAVPGEFDWTATDAIVFGAAARGLAVLGVITYAPAWAVPPEARSFQHPAPTDPQVFAEFSRLAAQRYGNVVHAWEIWNEPNIVEGFAPRPDARFYGAMLASAYAAIKSVDPAAIVVSGGLSPAIDAADSLSPETFVEQLTQTAAPFDGVGLHPYSSPQLLSEETQPWSSKVAIQRVGDILRRRGRADIPLWFTEFGASTARTPQIDGIDESGQRSGVSEDRQAEILRDGLAYLRSVPDGGPVFVFDHRDLAPPGDDAVELHYGLLRSDLTPKPSLSVVQGFVGGQ